MIPRYPGILIKDLLDGPTVRDHVEDAPHGQAQGLLIQDVHRDLQDFSGARMRAERHWFAWRASPVVLRVPRHHPPPTYRGSLPATDGYTRFPPSGEPPRGRMQAGV